MIDIIQDPEKNKLGEKGIHLTAAQKKSKAAAEAVSPEREYALLMILTPFRPPQAMERRPSPKASVDARRPLMMKRMRTSHSPRRLEHPRLPRRMRRRSPLLSRPVAAKLPRSRMRVRMRLLYLLLLLLREDAELQLRIQRMNLMLRRNRFLSKRDQRQPLRRSRTKAMMMFPLLLLPLPREDAELQLRSQRTNLMLRRNLLLSNGDERLLPRRRLPLRRKTLRLGKRNKRRPCRGPELAADVPAKLD